MSFSFDENTNTYIFKHVVGLPCLTQREDVDVVCIIDGKVSHM